MGMNRKKEKKRRDKKSKKNDKKWKLWKLGVKDFRYKDCSFAAIYSLSHSLFGCVCDVKHQKIYSKTISMLSKNSMNYEYCQTSKQ